MVATAQPISSIPEPNTTTPSTQQTKGPKPMSESTIAILKATAPVVKAHGTAITSTMYKTMFSEYPEVKNLFNMSHHRVKSEDGENTSQQTRTLANAVIAFAANCDKLGNLTEAVARMVHKHVSLDIRPEHYPIVGTCLLKAIQLVLKEAATPEIMTAWAEGYWFLADLLIDAENATRDQLEALPGGWSGFRQLRVDRKVQESDEITSFYLKSNDPSIPLITFKPGQYICLKFENLQENVLLRNYSLSSSPSTDTYRISVKREARVDVPHGIISCHLHDNVQEGDTLLVAPPCGHFYYQPSTKPIVFLSGGVGVTPLLSMLDSLVADEAGLQQRVTFVQYVRSPEVLAFKDHLDTVASNHELFTTHNVIGSAFDLSELEARIPSRDCEYYFCGPAGFMTTVHKSLVHDWSVDPSQVHYEYFGPTQDIDA